MEPINQLAPFTKPILKTLHGVEEAVTLNDVGIDQ